MDQILGPVRTCVGCGSRDARSALVRIVADTDGNAATVDPDGSRPGRGAWIHARQSCAERARKRRALVRALRLDPRDADLEAVWRDLAPLIDSAGELPDHRGAGPAPTDKR